MTHQLEDLRTERLVGEVAYFFLSDEPQPLLFHGYAIAAYVNTLNALEGFEKQDAIGPGPYVLPSIIFWFLSSEAYISMCYKAALQLEDRLGAEGRATPVGVPLDRTNNVTNKLRAVERFLTGEVASSSPHARLQEFASLRNDVFHDLTTPLPRRIYHHTKFSPRAEKANEADMIQAMLVAIEAFSYFRYLFYNADLMPSLHVGEGFEKLDVLARDVVLPAFHEVVAAKGLSTSLPTSPSLPMINVETRLLFRIAISHAGPTAPTTPLPDGKLRVQRLHDAAIARTSQPTSTTFAVPNYTRTLPT